MDKEIPLKIEKKENIVEIIFPNEIPRDILKEQIDSCQAETCECCTPTFRDKVEKFEVVEGDDIKVHITGSISAEQVKENVLSCMPKLRETD